MKGTTWDGNASATEHIPPRDLVEARKALRVVEDYAVDADELQTLRAMLGLDDIEPVEAPA